MPPTIAPAGGVEVKRTVCAPRPIVMVKACDWATGGLPAVESSAVTVKVKAPALVGVPDSVPPVASVSPLGSAPAVTA